MSGNKAGRRLGTMVMATLLSGVVVSSATVLKTSVAGFSATTDNPGNTWKTGQLALSDNDSSAVMFNSADIADGPLNAGQTLSKCIEVTYTGTFTANNAVKVYAANVANTTGLLMSGNLDVNIEEGHFPGATPAFGDCTGFVSDASIYNPDSGAATDADGNLDDFSVAATNFSNGVGTWTPAATGAKQIYRFTVRLNDLNTLMNQAATADFIWEIQNSAS